MKQSTWTLAVSTLITADERILGFLERNRACLGQFDEVLLICQFGTGVNDFTIPDRLLLPKIRVIPTSTRGISASRNVAIQEFQSDIIWFMDDDVQMRADLSDLRAAIAASPAEINTVRIQDIASDRIYKKYPAQGELGPLDLLRVSSIEITCKRSLFSRAALRFPEWIGIGTKLPGGEENLFLRQALRAGVIIHHLPIIGVRHPLEDFELTAIWNRPNRMRSMGIVARDCGAVGVLLCLRWSLRGLRAGVHRGRIADLWRGFFEGPATWAHA